MPQIIPRVSNDSKRLAFYNAFKGIPNHILAQVLNTLTPGSDWMGSSRQLMAEMLTYEQLGKFDLVAMRRRCDEIKAAHAKVKQRELESQKKSEEEEKDSKRRIQEHNNAVAWLRSYPPAAGQADKLLFLRAGLFRMAKFSSKPIA